MMLFRKILVCLLLPGFVFSQGGGPSTSVGDLPSYIPPTPEVASILKADFLGVSQNTGAANLNIPLYTLKVEGCSVPVGLSYNSTGVKVDDIASMVGMGWSLNYGGVVSRVVMGMPDEVRSATNNNLTSHNFSNPDYALLDYFDDESADKQSDIFSFSFGGYSGKFVLDPNLVPKQLSQSNLKISLINGAFMEGFIIITDDGAQYYFQNAETSMSRLVTGTNCKTGEGLDLEEVKTSWYLTKIITASRKKEINFTYTTSTTRFSNGISQTLTATVASENYLCSGGQGSSGPTGAACSGTRFTSCSQEQVVQTQFITKIETSDGDKIEFFYDPTGRSDLFGGLRLASLKVTNYRGNSIKNVSFISAYKTAVNGSSDYESKRLFLERLELRDSENTSNTAQNFLFSYNNNNSLPKRLSFSQDIYGFYNGKTSNTSLLPKLLSSDVNYSLFNNGTGYGAVTFGDRSIDSTYSKYGLLTSIVYPTGGRDSIVYNANYTGNEMLCGGVSVSKILSYAFSGVVAGEKEFYYRYLTNNQLTSFLITVQPGYSERRTVNTDGYVCSSPGSMDVVYCTGPTCTKAIISSNSNLPVTTSGSQHMYYRSVLEFTKDGTGNNGFTEHKYRYFMDGGLMPQVLMGEEIKNASFNIVPEILVGEDETNVYKKSGQSYLKVKSSITEYEDVNQSYYFNYFVRKNYLSPCSNRPGPVHSSELEAYDVTEGRIYFNTSRVKTVTERLFNDNGDKVETITSLEYGNNLYTYPTVIKVTDSKGLETKTTRTYPHDVGTLSNMVTRNIVSPVIEEKYFRNNQLLTTKKTTFIDWFSNNDLFVPLSVEVKLRSNTIGQKVVYNAYDIYGNVLDVSKENDLRNSYIWSYKHQYPIAQVVNAKATEVFHDNFEELSGWDGSLTAYDNTKNRTGKYSGRIDKPTSGEQTSHSTKWLSISLSAPKKFRYSTWVYSTGPSAEIFLFMKRANETGYFSYVTSVATHETNKWVLIEQDYLVPADVVQLGIRLDNNGGGTVWFDDVRLHPSEAMMTTYTFKPLVGMTSQTEMNNRTVYHEYDSFNRLIIARDNEGKIIKKICYNYAGQPEECNTFYNVVKTGNFTKNNCNGGQGSIVTYTVPADIYNASTQTGADSLAINDVNTNGQTYANQYGTCTYSSDSYTGYYYSNECGSGETPDPVYVNVPAAMFTSSVSQQDANDQALAYAQNYADTYGTCTSGVQLEYQNNTGDYIYVVMTNTSTYEQLFFQMTPFGSGILGNVPAGTYDVDMSTSSGWTYVGFGAGCSHFGYGYSAFFYNVSISTSCYNFYAY